MEKGKNNYFKLYRSLLSDDLWLKEPFTRGQAWVDLIGLANFERKEKFFRGELQIVKRGEIVASIKFFENRWKWSRNKVYHYFAQLEALQMVQVKSTTKGTSITIENYGIYQSRGTTKGTNIGVAEGETEGETEGTHNKNVKNEKKEKGPRYKIETINGVEVARFY